MAAPPTQSYRDLILWQRSVELCVGIYELTRGFPKEEIYGLSQQLRRAAVSIPSNVAEGYGRLTRDQYRHFLGIAQGSNFELQTQLVIANRLRLAEAAKLQALESLTAEVGKMLTSMLRNMPASTPKR